ncbi:MAG TPA: hypothetical protein VJA26_02760 [Gammaproteobacteria bacterium]|nr:hypothetical protein [Gammaproteobacteria bacterium]
MKIDFGDRHRGKEIKDLPTSYLKFLTTDFQPFPDQVPLVTAAKAELKRRHEDEPR